jgi:Glycosyltransferase family 87
MNKKSTLLIIWALAGLVTGWKQFSLSAVHSHINNFQIFKASFGHFLHRMPLYLEYPKEYFDLYLYGPIFAILMAPFSALPDGPSVILWNVLNSVVLFVTLWHLPIIENKRVAIAWIVLNSSITALLNTQFHALCLALILWSYICVENKKYFWATLWIVLGIYIKLYGVVGLAFFFFAKDRLRFAAYFVFWVLILGGIPLALGGFDYGIQTYREWMGILAHKNELNENIKNIRTDVCVMGMIRRWTGDPSVSNLWFLIPSMLVNVYLFFQTKKWSNPDFRLRILAFVLLYIMLASTGTESPTLVMAFPAVGIWFVLGEKTKARWAMLILTLLISSFSPTDLFPAYIRNEFINPLALMILPLFAVWIWLACDLFTEKQPQR